MTLLARRLDFTEDIPQLAIEAFEIAQRLCGPCRDFHALWPYVRLSRITGGVEVGRAALEPLLDRQFAGGRRKLFIAGAADTGQLALVARVGAPYGVEIVVCDRCATPLELCRRFSRASSFPIETLHTDVVNLELPERFDIVLAHFLMQFIAADRRVEALRRLRRTLQNDGRLVILEFTGRPIAGELAAEYRARYPDWVLDELDRLNTPLPEPRDSFRGRLEDYARQREAREGLFADAGQFEALLTAAGLGIEQRVAIELPLAATSRRFVSKLSKQAYLWVARRDLAS